MEKNQLRPIPWTNSPVCLPSLRETRMRQIVEILGKDARAKLSEISRHLDMPISTVFDYMKRIRKQYEFTIMRKGL